MKSLCPKCQKNPAIIDSNYGITECQDCRKKEEKPHRGTEFTTDSIREQRREYRKDILQPWHDGVLSKEYVEEYGTSGIKATPEQIKNAKPIYKGISGYHQFDKSKGGRRKG